MTFLENGIPKIYHLSIQIAVRTRMYTLTSAGSRRKTVDERPSTRQKTGPKGPERTI